MSGACVNTRTLPLFGCLRVFIVARFRHEPFFRRDGQYFVCSQKEEVQGDLGSVGSRNTLPSFQTLRPAMAFFFLTVPLITGRFSQTNSENQEE